MVETKRCYLARPSFEKKPHIKNESQYRFKVGQPEFFREYLHFRRHATTHLKTRPAIDSSKSFVVIFIHEGLTVKKLHPFSRHLRQSRNHH